MTECCTLHQGFHGGIVVAGRVADGIVDLRDGNVRMGLAQVLDRGSTVVHLHVAFALAAEHGKRNDGVVVHPREGLGFCPNVGDGRDDSFLRPCVSGISSARRSSTGVGAAQRADRLITVTELGVAAGHISVDQPHGAVHVAEP